MEGTNAGPRRRFDAACVPAFRELLAGAVLPVGHTPLADAERIELLASLEALKNTAAALQAQLAVDLDSSVRAQHAAAGVPVERQGQGVAAQVALARHESPHRGQQLLGLAKDLLRELPHTFAALRCGALNEYRATVVARESGCLDQADRKRLDAELFAGDDPAALTQGTRQLAGRARAITYRLDPAATARRCAQAAGDRRVSLRPAPDTMAYLTALVPVAQGVAAYAELVRRATAARASGDGRGKGQLMADLLIGRLLPTAADPGTPEASEPPAVTLTVDLVISDASLLGAGHEPASLLAAGVPCIPVPAQYARELVADSLDAPTPTWLRRLYADPGGRLVAMTSRARFARHGLADFLRIRDQGICRTPWCDAPVTESDHVLPAADGGATTALNTQGYCVGCNHAKQATGWRQRARDTDSHGGHTVETVTPTGHRYRSPAPAAPAPAAPAPAAPVPAPGLAA